MKKREQIHKYTYINTRFAYQAHIIVSNFKIKKLVSIKILARDRKSQIIKIKLLSQKKGYNLQTGVSERFTFCPKEIHIVNEKR